MWSAIVRGEHDFVREGFPTEVTFWANIRKMKKDNSRQRKFGPMAEVSQWFEKLKV